jgi:hypothetical protein
MRYVTVVNRTNSILQGTWDGRHVDLPPGKSQHAEDAAIAFKRQNPIRGTSDPYNATQLDLVVGSSLYKIGIEEHEDDCSPLGQVSESVERLDRALMPNAKEAETVQGPAGLYSRRSLDIAPLSSDTGFVKA